MGRYRRYAEELEALARRALAGKDLGLGRAKLADHLNGGAAAALDEAVSLRARRRLGAFFTGHSLRAELLAPSRRDGGPVCVWDPACGAGDLLLAASDHLRVTRDLEQTLQAWSTRLAGSDIEPDFVRVARARLILAAVARGSLASRQLPSSLALYFPRLTVRDLLRSEASIVTASDVLLNPPFGTMGAPGSCKWAEGLVSRAAVFLDRCVCCSTAGTRIAAILPDVLRTGSRYRVWREWIASRARVEKVAVYGRFTRSADVDVFILRLVVRDSSRPLSRQKLSAWARVGSESDQRLAEKFEVSVGSVVPHRDPEVGPLRSYLHARTTPPNAEIRRVQERRKYSGRVFSPPFLVLRRTSSPSDKRRVTASLVLGHRSVAVENHLIVLTPRRGGAEVCRRALGVLNLAATARFLNRRIRCRHLTVDAVGGIPWPKKIK